MEKHVSTLPNGQAVIDVVMFRGMLLAATHDGMFYLDGTEWKRVEMTPEAKPALYEYKPGGVTWLG